MGEILRYKQQGNHTKELLFTFKQNTENKIVQKCKFSIQNLKKKFFIDKLYLTIQNETKFI